MCDMNCENFDIPNSVECFHCNGGSNMRPRKKRKCKTVTQHRTITLSTAVSLPPWSTTARDREVVNSFGIPCLQNRRGVLFTDSSESAHTVICILADHNNKAAQQKQCKLGRLEHEYWLMLQRKQAQIIPGDIL